MKAYPSLWNNSNMCRKTARLLVFVIPLLLTIVQVPVTDGSTPTLQATSSGWSTPAHKPDQSGPVEESTPSEASTGQSNAKSYATETATAIGEWSQEAHDAQRTGYTPESPKEPWSFLWGWNGPDENGGWSGNFYTGPQRDARSITGGSHVYVPAGDHGLYALVKINGREAWHFTGANIIATPAYGHDPSTGIGYVYAPASNGTLYKIRATNGQVEGSYDARHSLNKPVLLAGNSIYIVTSNGELHKIDPVDMSRVWVYQANSEASTPAAYSASKDLLVYATRDLYVHAVRDSDGGRHWRVKPTTRTTTEMCGLYRYDYRWPVIADQHGIVFIRLRNPWNYDEYPTTNAAIRSRLVNNPDEQSLFALDLDDGSKAFIPAVGPTGADVDLDCGGPTLFHSIADAPVVRVVDGKEVAYVVWRNGQSPYDGRWDAHMGEMVLEDDSELGLAAGDLRFIEFTSQIDTNMISDEVHTISMAGETIMHHHAHTVDIFTILDRGNDKGFSMSNPIETRRNPIIVRWTETSDNDPETHFTNGGMSCVSRWYSGPGFWIYQGEPDYFVDPLGNGMLCHPEDCQEDGSANRYAYVSDGLIIVGGPRGDLFVLEHSGSTLVNEPSKAVTPASVDFGETVEYTISLVGTGGRLAVTDILPNGLSYTPGTASVGPVIGQLRADSTGVFWSGTPAMDTQLTLSYAATVTTMGRRAIVNTAVVEGLGSADLRLTATVIANGDEVYLPLVLSDWA
jgi:uncharacterized repeat protein (TIGR01451 family)